jgi:hypothetical protein
MIERDNLKFLKLLHATIRKDTDLSEPDRSRSFLAWVAGRGSAISSVITFDQRRLLVLVVDYFRRTQQAPSLAILQELVEKTDKSEILEAMFKEYLSEYESFPEYTAFDGEHLIGELQVETLTLNFIAALSKAKDITVMGVTGDPYKKEKDMRGVTRVTSSSKSFRAACFRMAP